MCNYEGNSDGGADCLVSLSCPDRIVTVVQISDEAKKFAYQTGIRVVVAYGGAPVHNQVCIVSLDGAMD